MHRCDGSWTSRFVLGTKRALVDRVAELERLVARARASETEAREQVEHAPVPLITLSRDLEFLALNRAASELIGKPPESLLGRSLVEELVPEPERVRSEAFYERLLAEDGDEASLELPILTGNGVRVVVLRHSVERGVLGDVRSILCAGEDLTDSCRALSELELLGRAIEEASDAVVMTDRLGVITFVNSAFERAVGRTRDAMTGKHASDLFDRASDGHRDMLDCIRDGTSWAGHLVGHRANGEPFDEDATVSPVRSHRGDLMGFVLVSRDVTEANRMRARVQMLERLESIRRLTGGIAHDFNNRLAVILGVCELALPSLPDGSPIRRDLIDVFEAAQRAALLTRQLLAFNRRQVMQPERLRLGDVLEEMRVPLEHVFGSEVALEIQTDSKAPWVNADKSHLEQVLLNLAVNSKDAMPSGGTFSLRESAVFVDETSGARLGITPGECALLEVRDTGAGMDEATVTRIFDPFFTTKPLGGGTGLGLSTVFGVVEQAGGHIEVDSEVGVGTTFRIFLPPADAIEKRALGPREAPQRSESNVDR
jgi:two-component system, cell cycle sensor histidine kinase and response regulator CckA